MKKLIVISILFFSLLISCTTPHRVTEAPGSFRQTPEETTDFEIPELKKGEAIRRQHGYFISFNREQGVANWVAYSLTPQQIQNKRIERTNDFRTDSHEKSSPAPADYESSGYDRGHLAPAEDMRWSEDSERDSFLMTNMTPQTARFNRGIWKRLESKVRLWAKKQEHTYVVTGPVLPKGCLKRLLNKICAPKEFFKVILGMSRGEFKAIGFMIPQEYVNSDLKAYAVSIKDVEASTGLNFFPKMRPEVQDKIENNSSLYKWEWN